MFIIENDIPAKDMLSGHVFGFCQFFICNVYFPLSWPPTRRVRPNRIPVVCFEIVGLFDHESPLEVTPMCRSRGGGTPLENHKNIGFLSNTGLDPLKNHKATKPAFNVGLSSARQLSSARPSPII